MLKINAGAFTQAIAISAMFEQVMSDAKECWRASMLVIARWRISLLV